MKLDKLMMSLAAASAFVLSSHAEDFLTNGLVAYFPFNGNAHDESGQGHDGSVIGAILATDRFGQPNNCYQFNGTSAYIKAFADGLPTRSKTVSLWFSADTVATLPALLGYGGGGCGTSFLLSLGGGGVSAYKVAYHCNPPGAIIYPWTQTPTNTWTHWVVTVSESQAALYLDGVKVLTTNQAIVPTSVLGTVMSLGVSVSPDGGAPYSDANIGFFQGRLDDVRIYDRAMTDKEVRQLYFVESHYLNTLAITVKTVQVDMLVTTNKQYQLEASRDLLQWTPVGIPFTATSPLVSQDVDSTETGMFFRFHEVF